MLRIHTLKNFCSGARNTFSLFLIIFSIFAIPLNSIARPNWFFTPSISVSEEYDSNVNSTASGVEDYVTKVGTNLNTKYIGQDVKLEGAYLLHFNTYARSSRKNVVTHDGRLNVVLVGLNRWFQGMVKGGGLTVSDSFTFTPDLRDNYIEENGEISTLSNPGIIRTRRSSMMRNSSGLNITVPVKRLVNLTTSYSNILTNYSNPLYKDNVNNNIGLGINYSLKRDMIYSNFNASAARVEQVDSNNYSLVLGIKHNFSPFTSFDINTGVVLIDSEVGKNDINVKGSASFTERLKQHVYHIGYSRGENTTSGISTTPTIADLYYINITNIHSQYLTSAIGANYSNNRSSRGNDVDMQSYKLSGSLNYVIQSWLKCSLAVSHFNQKSRKSNILTVSDMQRNLITLTISGTWN